MKKLLRVFVAGWGAKKIGGRGCGCFGVIFFFIIIYILLGPIFKMI